MKSNTAAAYVRVSTLHDAQKDSPENQRMLCSEKAFAENLDLAFFYEDRSSGTSIMGREDMQNLIEDAKKGYFKTIIFASLSRFARNTADALNVKELLVDALGIRLIAIDENYDSSVDKDNMKFTLFSMMNEKYAQDVSLRSRSGIRMSAKKGNFTGSRAPFGYKKVVVNQTKTLEIVEKDAEIVRMIYDLYVNEDMGEKQITNYLNARGIPSPTNKLWGITTLQRILQNEAYIGCNVYNKYTVEKRYDDLNNMQDRKKRLVQKAKEEWLRNEEKNWEAILEDEVFHKAQKIRQSRYKGSRGGVRIVQVNPLADIIKCAHCGSNLVSMKAGKTGKNGQVYRYLICSKRRRQGEVACENGLWLPLEDYKTQLIQNVKEQFSKHISTINIEEKIERELKKQKKPTPSSHITIEKLEKEITKNRRYLFELRKDLKNEEIDKEQYNFEKEEMEKEITKLQKQMKQLQPVGDIIESNEEIKRAILEAIDELKELDHKDIKELNTTLKKLIHRIEVNNEGHTKVYTPLGEF
ncbi:recombinase family protein [Bacillus sp. RO1]|uniref:recombinase family protein n=1 Tax=Bacillus sp. RO1 TaxID=2722703 RepID=UPI0014574717|nr:recombinase family protein [Bacillus sp. RO1]NLP50260.1 recombinase family protein [Bacillus sp. RO1]